MDLHRRIVSSTGYLIGCALLIAFSVGAFAGWIWNVVKVVQTIADPLTGLFILRCVGILVPPLGAVLGFL